MSNICLRCNEAIFSTNHSLGYSGNFCKCYYPQRAIIPPLPSAYQDLFDKLAKAEETIQQMNDNCVSLLLHESRMQSVEAELSRYKTALEKCKQQRNGSCNPTSESHMNRQIYEILNPKKGEG